MKTVIICFGKFKLSSSRDYLGVLTKSIRFIQFALQDLLLLRNKSFKRKEGKKLFNYSLHLKHSDLYIYIGTYN